MAVNEYPPTAEQQAVIEDSSDDVLVVAGAGTGKTTTMVARYLHLLEAREYEPREILAFTFTDKAAGELRERVRKALQQQSESQNEESPQVVSMSDAWIGTFHAICLRILKAWPIEARVDPGFTVIDDVTAETMRGEAFSSALELLREETDKKPLAEGRLSFEEMIGILRENELRRAAIFTYDELRSRGLSEPKLPPFQRLDAYPAAELGELVAVAKRVRNEKQNGWGSKQEAAISFFEDLDGTDRQPSFDELCSVEFSKKNAEGAAAELMETLPDFRWAVARFEFGDDCRDMFGRLIELFASEFEELKRRRSVLDYEDLQLKTVRLLREKPWVRRAYVGRFREVMVDEFQDTNQLQLDLVELLRNDPGDPNCVPDRPRTTLVTVGDEMQSIYSFRHADVELFRERERKAGVSVRQLTENFRSRPAVIDAVNTIGEKLRTQAHPASEFPKLQPGLDEHEDQSATLILTAIDGWKEQDLGDLGPVVPPEVGKQRMHQHEAEALQLARHLHHLVRVKNVPQNEIAILFRATSRVPIYAKALRQFGLTPYIAKSSGFWESREALDMRALLGVIANPLDDESLATMLASPACGISSDALWLLAAARPGNWIPLWRTVEWSLGGAEIPAGESESDESFGKRASAIESISEGDRVLLARFAERIETLRKSAFNLPLDELSIAAAEATGYDLACMAEDPSGNAWAGVRRFATLAREYEDSEGRDLRGLLDWAALSAELDKEAETATADENSDVIRLMTVHAAKGLEFGVVCVPDCGRGVGQQHNLPVRIGRPTSDDPNDFRVALRLTSREGNKAYVYGWDDLVAEADQANQDEELRLFHVALTRAKRHLVISGVMTGRFDTSSTGRPMITRTCNGIEPEELHPDKVQTWETEHTFDLSENHQITVLANNPTPEQAKKLRSGEDATERSRLEINSTPPLHRPAFRTFPNVPLSFTAMNEFAECPTAFYAKRILGLPEPDARPTGPEDPETASLMLREDATRFGSTVHDLLEMVGKRSWRAATELEIREALDRRRVFSDENLERAYAMITGFLDSELGVKLRSSTCGFEVPLILRIDQVTIRGFADLIVEDASPLILDYKTNQLLGKQPEERMKDYIDQRDLYALAVADSRGIDEVRTAYVFLEDADHPVVATLDRAALAEARERLKESLAEITAGHYFGGEGARTPCGSCWACRELAPRLAA